MLAELGEFDLVKSEKRLLSPISLFGLGKLANRFLAPLPVFRQLSLRHYSVCRSWRYASEGTRSATVVVPARNERGNIEAAVLRMPRFCDDIEIIFVEGHSRDGTLEEMNRVKEPGLSDGGAQLRGSAIGTGLGRQPAAMPAKSTGKKRSPR
jgi:hypothetical protein